MLSLKLIPQKQVNQSQNSPLGHLFVLINVRTPLIIFRWLVVQAMLNYPSAALRIPMWVAFLPISPPITSGTKHLDPRPFLPLPRNLPKQLLEQVKQLGANFYTPTEIGAPLLTARTLLPLLPNDIPLLTCLTVACLIIAARQFLVPAL